MLRKLQLLLTLVFVTYVACWFATVPEIHRRQTDGAISTSMPEQSLPIKGEGMQYGTLHSAAYALAPFYYYGQVSRRFSENDGYPEMHRYIGFGHWLMVLDGDRHGM